MSHVLFSLLDSPKTKSHEEEEEEGYNIPSLTSTRFMKSSAAVIFSTYAVVAGASVIVNILASLFL